MPGRRRAGSCPRSDRSSPSAVRIPRASRLSCTRRVPLLPPLPGRRPVIPVAPSRRPSPGIRHRSTADAVASRITRAASRRAARVSRRSTAARAAGIAAGLMLNSLRPSPTSSGSTAGSAAISPQSDTGSRAVAAALITPRSVRSTAGWSGSNRCDTRASVRSTASEYWIEIVRSDAEEVGLPRQQVGGQRRRRYLDHDADRRQRGRPAPRATPAPSAASRNGRFRLAELLDARDEREDDPQPAVPARPQQRPQLHLEQVAPREAQPRCRAARVAPLAALPRERPGCGSSDRRPRPPLPVVDVEGAHRDRAGAMPSTSAR